MDVCWPYFDPDYENFTERINGPRCASTMRLVASVNKQGFLLQVVQALTDMNLSITKGYISSDAGWFMDVFHVKDEHGKKLRDQSVINYIQQAIYARRELQDTGVVKTSTAKAVGAEISKEHTAIELTGTDRPGLFSEISAALTDLRCNVEEAHAWSHNKRLACVAYISDQSTASCIDDPLRLSSIKDHLATIINATNSADAEGVHHDHKGVETAGLPGGDGTTSSVERRLHQLMFSVHDFDYPQGSIRSSALAVAINSTKEGRETVVLIENCNEKGYSVVSIESKDRQRLMFDTVCTLTDMQYVIFHATIRSYGDCAFQEYYIRHIDGCPLNTETEKLRVRKCLQAAIERRVCEGIRLELRADNRVGLLSDITRILREYGLAVVRADVATKGEKMVNAFYVRDISGNKVDMRTVESIKKEMESIALEVKTDTARPSSPDRTRFSFSDMLRSQIERISHNFIPIK
ncbi:hypothetical protein IFM89_012363 [Coptis chinensis]|uniref:ACT domain-containing protein ACR n=1 Tax=Coptis chinensis TaxID=261450 RepID=A0A835I9Q2_9MAGN|nr:hypothetical protein IFM89_012363 [Coptis chinensis]